MRIVNNQSRNKNKLMANESVKGHQSIPTCMSSMKGKDVPHPSIHPGEERPSLAQQNAKANSQLLRRAMGPKPWPTTFALAGEHVRSTNCKFLTAARNPVPPPLL